MAPSTSLTGIFAKICLAMIYLTGYFKPFFKELVECCWYDAQSSSLAIFLSTRRKGFVRVWFDTSVGFQGRVPKNVNMTNFESMIINIITVIPLAPLG